MNTKKNTITDDRKIAIGDRIYTRQELFEEQEILRKEQARIPFEEKVKILVSLQKIAATWGGKKDAIVWKI